MSALVPEIHVGSYALDIGTDSGSFARFDSDREKENAAALASALAEESDSEPTLVGELERFEQSAEAVTGRIERANELSRAAAEGRLLESDMLVVEIDGLLGLLERLDRAGRFEEQLRLARALHGLLALSLRWLDLIRSLRGVLRSAQIAGDQTGQAWALHELGSLHLVSGNPDEAAQFLTDALGIEERVQDAGWCATRHNLDSARRASYRGPPPWRRLVRFGSVVAAVAVLGGSGTAVTGITEPRISLPSASLDLGRVAVGDVAREQMNVTNVGTTPATMTRVASNRREFRVESNCLRVLRPGEECHVQVRFEPRAVGPFSARLTIGGDRIRPPPVRLSGTGVPVADATVEPERLDLGSVPVGRESESQTVTVTAGQRELTIDAADIDSAEFSAQNGCAATIAARSRCSVSIRFRPREPGARRATLTISRAGSKPFIVGLAGRATAGHGAAGRVAVSPAGVDFGSAVRLGKKSEPRELRLTNVGDSTISVQAALAGDTRDFTLASGCPGSLGPARSCELQVTFSPQAAGARSDALKIRGGPGKPILVALHGTGVGVTSEPTLAPRLRDFGTVELLTSSKPFSFTLAAGSDAFTPRVELTGAKDFTLENQCAPQLAPRRFCALDVTFTPAAAGQRKARLTVSNTGGSPLIAELTGAGNVVPPQLTPAMHDFGTLDVGVSKSEPYSFKLAAGSEPLEFRTSLGATKDFRGGGTCTDTLEPHATCTVDVTFAPQGGGARRATLVVATSEGPTLSSAVTGTGTVLPPVVTPKAVDFSTILVGRRSPAKTFSVRAGSFAIKAAPTPVTGSREFVVSRNDCAGALAPFAACSFDVVFAPTVFGPRSARLRLANVAGGTATMRGYGWAKATWSIKPRTLKIWINHGQVSATESLTLTVSLGSEASLLYRDISVSGSDYFQASSDCPSVVQVGSTCTIAVTLKPTGALAYPDDRATLVILTRNGGRRSVRLSGEYAPD